MGWERRRKGPSSGYYYRSVRVGDQVRKVYLGRGEAAHAAAAELDGRRQARREAELLLKAELAEMEMANRLAAEVRAWAGGLATAWLILAGHHKHHGQWRRTHG
jgi:hypothetical protein